ncbi:amino acid ABC transporter substrate-binding protein [Limnobacter litoralis]|uniref:Amino acid ABC transporter substrate-binding protein n=1 Tax=Limnobacter litoralis TaxID=481366 RepID=A0ABQ5YQ12_9BURK|nr:amino acid ABC transporter substrate-binding protein [Limnobacter litoralis]GLR25316.1 amino acid ABC transporter substrate-binding protein [Limnobacter litoralis]
MKHRNMIKVIFSLLCCLPGIVWAGSTLDGVRQRGEVRCGVSSGVAGFSALGEDGQWHGLDVDVCRAVAAAVLGDANKVRYTPLSSQQRFAALQARQIDILSRNTTWTLSRDAGLGIVFTGITYFDGQGVLVPKSFHLKSARQLNGAEICVQSGTTNEKNLATFLKANRIKAKAIVYDNFEAAYKAFFSGRCQAFSTDVSALIGLKTKQALHPDDYDVLPEVFSKEPLGPAVLDGDTAWFLIVRWVAFAMIEAEELGVGQANLQTMLNSDNPAVARLLGQSEDLGKPLGLPKNWVQQILKQVGNYGEVFDRNLGAHSPLGLKRGLNDLWTRGGLMYAPPLR